MLVHVWYDHAVQMVGKLKDTPEQNKLEDANIQILTSLCSN